MSNLDMKKFNPADGQHYSVDPVCKMKVDPENMQIKVRYNGETYCFCSELCKRMFEREPQKYVESNES